MSVGGITPGAQPICTGGAWSITGLNVSSLTDGTVTITADHDDSFGNSAAQVTQNVQKDTTIPTVAITGAQNISLSNENIYSVSGTCSEDTQVVIVNVGGITLGAQPTCSSGIWSVTGLNVSGLTLSLIHISEPTRPY